MSLKLQLCCVLAGVMLGVLSGCGSSDPLTALKSAGARVREQDGKVLSVSFFNANISDSGLKHLQAFGDLEKLVIQECKQVSDAGLQHIAGLTNVKTMQIGRAHV